MSSPIYRTDDLDGALKYAPPRVRVQRQQTSEDSDLAAEEPQPHEYGDDGDRVRGGRNVPPMPRRHPLDPEIVPAPPPDVDEKPSAGARLLRLCGAAAVAAIVAWAIVEMPGASLLKHGVQAEIAAAAISTDRGSKDLSRMPSTAQIAQRDEDVGAQAQPRSQQARPGPMTASLPVDAPRAKEPPPPATAQPPPGRTSVPGFVLRQLDRDEVMHLVKRGEEFIASGDLAAARLVLQRAAEAGDVRAALALAGTFDPILLAKSGKQDLADAASARLWYERAKQFGSAEAPRRLEQLATQLNAIH